VEKLVSSKGKLSQGRTKTRKPPGEGEKSFGEGRGGKIT